jgi:hypothetical protein
MRYNRARNSLPRFASLSMSVHIADMFFFVKLSINVNAKIHIYIHPYKHIYVNPIPLSNSERPIRRIAIDMNVASL